MKNHTSSKIILVLGIILSLASCKKGNNAPSSDKSSSGSLKTVTFNFKATDQGMSDFMNGMIMFQNAAGNEYGVTYLKYLVSDITLQATDGEQITFDTCHYVDISDPGTLQFTPSKKIPTGSYKSITMTFGLKKADNVSGSNPYLNILSWNWPEIYGGGYHYMQLGGQFINNSNDTVPYNTHFGSTIDTTTNDTINNEIEITMVKNFNVTGNVSINLVMNINEWYEHPDVFDLNQYGGAIMGNYQAQIMLHDNGGDVFSIGDVTNQ